MNVVQHEKHQTKKKVINIIKSFVLLIIFASIYLVVPKLVLSYYESNGYTFSENIGHITQYSYDNSVTTHDQDITFEYEIKVQRDSVSINDFRYAIVFSDSDIFDLGMSAQDYYMSIFDFYDFEFLYGNPFLNDNEIVLSESISFALFDQIDSVGESIEINGVEYRVSGIVYEQNEKMAYIYTSSNNIDRILNQDWTFDDFIFFKDNDLQMKLYERGGIDLVRLTETRINQQTLISNSQLIISVSFLIIAILNIVVRLNFQESEKEKQIEKSKFSYTKSLFKSLVAITIFMMYIVIFSIAVLAMGGTIPVASSYVLDLISKFYWIFSIYAIPVVYITYKGIKNRRSVDNK